jgi:hypothetical protein
MGSSHFISLLTGQILQLVFFVVVKINGKGEKKKKAGLTYKMIVVSGIQPY